MPARKFPRLRRLLNTLTLLLLLLVAIGLVYEQIGRWNDAKRLPRIGQAIDIGGRTLNLYCSGADGPSVILDSGASSPGYSWSHIQPEIAKFARACWYDRAGDGWSDPGPFPRTSAAIARDLHELLTRAGVPTPYVLVGHSFGGLNVRVYNGLYPNDVAGMVLVDSAHEDEPLRAPPFFLGHGLPPWAWHPMSIAAGVGARIGFLRLIAPTVPLPDDPAQRSRAQLVRALRAQPKSAANDIVTGLSVRESYAQAHAAAGLGDRPLIVLTAGKPAFADAAPEIARQAAAYHQVWMHELQAQLVKLSTRGRQIIVSNSGHGIPDQAPEAVIDAVRQVVADARASARTRPIAQLGTP
jgi:pimeloyl-ACP methyl ester carboxylesterase